MVGWVCSRQLLVVQGCTCLSCEETLVLSFLRKGGRGFRQGNTAWIGHWTCKPSLEALLLLVENPRGVLQGFSWLRGQGLVCSGRDTLSSLPSRSPLPLSMSVSLSVSLHSPPTLLPLSPPTHCVRSRAGHLLQLPHRAPHLAPRAAAQDLQVGRPAAGAEERRKMPGSYQEVTSCRCGRA